MKRFDLTLVLKDFGGQFAVCELVDLQTGFPVFEVQLVVLLLQLRGEGLQCLQFSLSQVGHLPELTILLFEPSAFVLKVKHGLFFVNDFAREPLIFVFCLQILGFLNLVGLCALIQ